VVVGAPRQGERSNALLEPIAGGLHRRQCM
jgi:hypothetical protein